MTEGRVGDDLTDDLFFGGKLRLLQPKKGHRFGGDAALLAAAARSRLEIGALAADFGAGVGSVGLALAWSGAGRVALVEIDPRLAGLASENARRNGLFDKAAVLNLDVDLIAREPRGPKHALGICLVAMNPPFDDAARFRASPDAEKAGAHVDLGDTLEVWLKAAWRMLRPGGSLVLIHRPEALNDLLAALQGRFGEVRLRPVHPRAKAPASRLLVAARKESRAALAILPPLVMHGADGGFTPEADAAQRGDAVIAMD